MVSSTEEQFTSGDDAFQDANGVDDRGDGDPRDLALFAGGDVVRSTANGSRMRGTACSGPAQQQFTLNKSRDLVSLSASKCVDVTDWNSGNGVPAQIWTCAGTDNQKWN